MLLRLRDRRGIRLHPVPVQTAALLHVLRTQLPIDLDAYSLQFCRVGAGDSPARARARRSGRGEFRSTAHRWIARFTITQLSWRFGP